MAKQPAKGRKTPPKAKKPAAKAAKAPESPAEAKPVIDAIPAEVHDSATKTDTSAKTTPTAAKDRKPAASTAPQPKPKPAPEQATAPTVPKTAPAKPASAPAPAAQQSNSFLPLALGGLLAGVIGFAVATFTAPATDSTMSNQVATQSAAISDLNARLAQMAPADLSGIEEAQAALSSDLSDISASLTELTTRVAALEERPAGVVVSGDVEGVSDEMDVLRAQIAEMTNAAQTELDEARAAAASIEENAAEAARNAAARAALARVQTALESGAPIGAALADLEEATGQPAPDALLAVQDGVPTLASLQDEFPEAARIALATARSEGVAGEASSGIGAFLRTQLDVRSTTPRDGEGVDAILSRAEAAVKTGRLSDAIAEAGALPEVARAEMSNWLNQAEARASAIAAADILSSNLSDN